MDPQQQSGSVNEDGFTRAIADSLTNQNATTKQIEPWLASSWSVNADATIYTFHLRRGVTYSDGSPFDATVVKANFDYIKNTLAARAYRGSTFLAAYKGTDVVDDYTAVVRFSKPSAQFLNGTYTPALSMLSAGTTKKAPGARCLGEVIGSGPFTLESFDPSTGAVLKKRPGYDWAPESASHRGEAYLDAIEAKVIPDSNVRAGALRSGQVDASIDLAAQDAPNLTRGNTAVGHASAPGMSGSVLFNTKLAGLGEQPVRQAILHAVDIDTNVTTVLGGLYQPATSPITSALAAHSDESALMAHDPARSRRLLDAAGWTPGPDGIRQRNGQRLAYTLVLSSEWNGSFQADLAQLYQQDLKDVGIEVTINDVARSQFLDAARSEGTGMFVLSSTASDPDQLWLVLSSYYPDQATLTSAGIPALIDEERAQPDVAQRNATYQKIQQKILADALMLPVYENAQIMGWQRSVGGLSLSPSMLPQFYDAYKQQ